MRQRRDSRGPGQRRLRHRRWAAIADTGLIGLTALALASSVVLTRLDGAEVSTAGPSAPLVTSPPTSQGPPPTRPDAQTFTALGLPAPPTAPAQPTTHLLATSASDPLAASSAVAPSATSTSSTIDKREQEVRFTVRAPVSPTTMDPPRPGSVLGEVLDRRPATPRGGLPGPLARTGAWLVDRLLILGLALVLIGSIVRIARVRDRGDGRPDRSTGSAHTT